MRLQQDNSLKDTTLQYLTKDPDDVLYSDLEKKHNRFASLVARGRYSAKNAPTSQGDTVRKADEIMDELKEVAFDDSSSVDDGENLMDGLREFDLNKSTQFYDFRYERTMDDDEDAPVQDVDQAIHLELQNPVIASEMSIRHQLAVFISNREQQGINISKVSEMEIMSTCMIVLAYAMLIMRVGTLTVRLGFVARYSSSNRPYCSLSILEFYGIILALSSRRGVSKRNSRRSGRHIFQAKRIDTGEICSDTGRYHET